MSAPLEKLLARIEETIEIIDKGITHKYEKKLNVEEITSALLESIDTISKKKR